MKFSCIIGTITEEEIKKSVNNRMEGNKLPEELLGDLQDYYYTDEYWVRRFNDLRFLYWLPSALYIMFSDLVEINGIEWIDLILNDAKMEYMELFSQWGKNNRDMLTYMDLCADRVKLLNDKMLSRMDVEYKYNPELLRIFHDNKSNMQLFLKNIQGQKGANIVHRVTAAIDQKMIYADDAKTPLYKALKALGCLVTSLQNWNRALYSKKRVPLIE